MPLPNPYLPGTAFGLPASCMVHRLANIATDKLRCGENCRIDAFVTITGDVTLDDCVHIGTGAIILGGGGLVQIGTGTSISPGAKIFSATEAVDAPLTSNPQCQERAFKSGAVHIGSFCVIGAGSVVLPRAIIIDEAVVGALSLVPFGRTLGFGGVFAGIPVRFIKPRQVVNRLKSLLTRPSA